MNLSSLTRYTVLLGVLTLDCLSAFGTIYYVRTDGNNANSGTSWDLAKQTIQAGVTAAANPLDEVVVSNGTYVLAGEIAISRIITVRGLSENPADTIVNANAASRCFNMSASGTVANLTITNGLAASGGGVYMTAGVLRNCRIVGNLATGDPAGGGILMNNSTLVENCFISSNRASSTDGGGILMYAGTVRNCQFERNTCTRWGGAVRMDNGMICNSTFTSNFTPSSGPGAVQMRVNSPAVSNCVFIGNSAAAAGALEAAAGHAYGCVFTRNTSSGDSSGAALFVGGSALVDRCVLTNNWSTGNDGGGACMYGGTIRNTLFAGNKAPRYGGAIRKDGGTIENCTLVCNQSLTAYGGMWNRGGDNRNLIVYSNAAPSAANYDSTMAAMSNSCTYPLPSSGTGNITNDPVFVSIGTGFGTNHLSGNYRLQKNSPCRDKGLPSGWMTNARDLTGNWRLSGAVDLGAYEYTPQKGSIVSFY